MSAGVAGASSGTVTFAGTIDPPATKSVDISFVDNARGLDFLADRTTNAVALIDAQASTLPDTPARAGGGGHSVAAYARNNHVFDPEKSGSGIAVFASS